VVSAPDGLQIGTRRALDELAHAQAPRIVVINRMDRPCDPNAVVDALERAAGAARVVPLQVPIFESGRFVGVVDLLDKTKPVPEDLADTVEIAYLRLVEAVALSVDDL